jgi:hypothetical protein
MWFAQAYGVLSLAARAGSSPLQSNWVSSFETHLCLRAVAADWPPADRASHRAWKRSGVEASRVLPQERRASLRDGGGAVSVGSAQRSVGCLPDQVPSESAGYGARSP